VSGTGDCYDSAAMESWFSTVKTELGEHFGSYAQAKEEVFDYVEVFYNGQRRHSSLGYLSPVEFERRAPAMALTA
jgi:transposase InsO family protein